MGKLSIRVEGLEGVVASKEMEVTAAQTRGATDLQQLREQHEKELEVISQRVKQAIKGKDAQLHELEDRLADSERARGELERSFAEISRGLKRS
jgi:hypothetical protein